MLVLEWEHLKTVKHETGIDYVEYSRHLFLAQLESTQFSGVTLQFDSLEIPK